MRLDIESGFIRYDAPQQETFRMHTHNNYEIYLFLSGDADYIVEGNRYPLHHGDLMLMRRGEAHHLGLRSPAAYDRAVINFVLDDAGDLPADLMRPFLDRPLGKFNQYRALLFPDNHWQYYVRKICDAETDQKKLCYLLPLLSDLGECFDVVRNSAPGYEKDRASAIIRYINNHLEEDLSLDQLAAQFYLSKTHLNRIFKHSTGSTVWEYITVKRLFQAREMIRTGELPTRACQQCGFRDYTTFYRAYRLHFGSSPGHDNPA